MATTIKHLWDADHPYYCSDENWLGRSDTWGNTSQTWAEFVGNANHLWDPELNLVFRWDWTTAEQYELDEGEPPSWGPRDRLQLFIMLQRKGHFRVVTIEVEKSDEPAVRAFLERSWQAMRDIWAPLSELDS